MVRIKIISDKYSNPHFSIMQIVIFVGSIFENNKEKGISHFIEHLIFKGSKYNVNIKNLTDSLNSNGMSINAYTNNYTTVFHITTPTKFIKKAIETLIEIVFNPLFRNIDIDNERKVVINELIQKLNTPEKYSLIKSFEKIFSKKNPLHYTVIGYKDILEKITHDDIENYYNKYYNESNTLFLGIVNLKNKSYIKKLWNNAYKKYGNKLVKNQHQHISTKDLYKTLKNDLMLKNNPKKYVLSSAFPHLKSSHIKITYNLPNMTSKEYCALDIFSNYLTSSLSSILYDELREKRQLIYSISSYIYQISNNFLFSFVFNCKKDTARINKCIFIITKILKSFYKNGITSKEFNKFKIKSISDYEYHHDRTQDEINNYIRMYYMDLPKINYMKCYTSITNSFLKKTVCNKLKGSKKFIFIV